MTCPVVRAIREIKGGAGGEEKAGVAIGSGEGSEMYHTGDAIFRAAAAKLELARYKLGDKPYDGDLIRFFGQQRRFALCYLLDSSNSTLCRELRHFVDKFGEVGPSIAPNLCLIYPGLLQTAVNDLIDHLAINVEPLPELVYDKQILNGFFPSERNEESLNRIADELMQVAEIASMFEEYQLHAAAKLVEITRARHLQ